MLLAIGIGFFLVAMLLNIITYLIALITIMYIPKKQQSWKLLIVTYASMIIMSVIGGSLIVIGLSFL